MANRYNDQDYPRYYDRDDQYNQRSEYSSGRERAEGGSNDYGRRNNGMEYDREANQNRANAERARSEGNRAYNEDYNSTYSQAGNFRRERDNEGYAARDRQGEYGGERNERDRGYLGSERGYDAGRNTNQNSNEGRGRGAYSGDSSGREPYRGSSESSYGAQGDYDRSSSYYGQGGSYERQAGNSREERGFLERTTDSIAGWFGDDEARRRRERDQREYEATHRGRGPRGYKRSDERIRDDVNDRLTDYAYLDASDIEVEVKDGEVILTGLVEDRRAKRIAEDITDSVSGVNHVENRLRVRRQTEGYNAQAEKRNLGSDNNNAQTGATALSGTNAGTSSDFATISPTTTSTNTTAEGGTGATGAVAGSFEGSPTATTEMTSNRASKNTNK